MKEVLFTRLDQNTSARWFEETGKLEITDLRVPVEIKLSPQAQIQLVRLLETIVERGLRKKT